MSAVGDVVLATPVVRHLKSLTSARIAWAVDEGIASLLEGHPDVDELILFPRDPFRPFVHGLPTLAPKLIRLLQHVRRRPFDLAIDLQGRGRSYLLLQLSRAPKKIGRGNFPFLQQTVAHRRKVARHAVESYFETTDLLAMPRPEEPRLVLPDFPEDREKVRRLLGKPIQSDALCVLAPGTTWPSKRWPPEHWARLTDWLAERGYTVVLTGSRGEARLGESIKAKVSQSKKMILLFGSLHLRQLTSLFDLSRLTITIDNGPMHIAAATRTRLVALFGPTDPVRTGPWPPGRSQILTAPGCRQCRLPHCRRGCMKNLLPDSVLPVLQAALS